MKTEIKECIYTVDYFNYENQTFNIFKCHEESIDGKYCIFHVSPKFQIDSQQLFKRFNEKIQEGIENNTTILLIGYNLPKLYFKMQFSENQYLPNQDETHHNPDIAVPIYFSASVFHEHFEITNNHFKAIYFDKAHFMSNVIIAASLIEKASFKECTFHEKSNFTMFRTLDVDFSFTNFKKQTEFSNAKFFNSNFFNTIFESESTFDEAWFEGQTIFNRTKFLKNVTFRQSHFMKISKFHFTKFYDEADFNGTIFNNRTDFYSVLFKNQEDVLFNSALDKVSFKNTDITRIRIGDMVTWNKNNKVIDEKDLEWSIYPIFSITKNNYLFRKDSLESFLKFKGLIDMNYNYEFIFSKNIIEIIQVSNIKNYKTKIGDIELSNERIAVLTIPYQKLQYTFYLTNHDSSKDFYSERIDIENILTIYRNLRENYEFRLRYNEAGMFFIREMEIKRKYNNNRINFNNARENNLMIQNLSATGLYYHLAKYGESALRPAIFGICILIFSIIFFGSLPDSFEKVSIYSFETMNLGNLGNFSNLERAIERAWEDFIPLFPLNQDINFGLMDLAIKVIGGILTFGFITIALKRRFERKHRH